MREILPSKGMSFSAIENMDIYLFQVMNHNSVYLLSLYGNTIIIGGRDLYSREKTEKNFKKNKKNLHSFVVTIRPNFFGPCST